MNPKKRILKALKAHGYTGADNDIEALLKYIAENDIQIPDPRVKDGAKAKMLDDAGLKAIWAERTTLALVDDAEDDDAGIETANEAREDINDGTDPNSPGMKAANAMKGAKVARVNKDIHEANQRGGGNWASTMSARATREKSLRKAYNVAASAGKTAFSDADQAEAAGAFYRLAIMAQCGDKDYAEKARDLEIVGKDLSGTVNTAGGALVPAIFHPDLIYLTEPVGVARQLANVVPMARMQDSFPRKTGIQAMAAISQNGTIGTGDTTYDNVQLTAKDWGIITKVSLSLFEDSAISISDDMAKSMYEAQQRAEDGAYFIGDGSATYNNEFGLVSALPSGAYIAQGTSNTWAAQVVADIQGNANGGIMGTVQNVDWARCKFVCSRQYFHQVILRLTYGTARGSYQKDDAIASLDPGGRTGTIFGIPCLFSQLLPTATSTTARSLYFGDFMGASMIGDRKQLSIAASEHAYFGTGQIGFRAISRFAINIHGDGRGSTYGPITCLKNG